VRGQGDRNWRLTRNHGELLLENEPDKLRLGKGVAFVKSHLRRLPLGDDVWEADFMWALSTLNPRETVWVGLIVHRDGWVVTERMMDQSPTVNDMAALLARAMQGPYDQDPRRPQIIRLRARREWQELHPHLAQLGIKVIAAPRLDQWDKAFKETYRQVAKKRANAPSPKLERAYPSVFRFVQTQGWIEIGDQEGVGFVVRALDYGGQVFESKKPKTLAEALAALEKGIAEHLEKA
jgi:hypothetical protein